MTNELKILEKLFLKIGDQPISDLTEEKECTEYVGYNFHVGALQLKFRKSKITPKKVGQFVTLWRRNAHQQTEPFHAKDDFDFYIFLSEDGERNGIFLFSKSLLIEKNILSTDQKEGKRGFRLYPTWARVNNRQAEKTQAWQTNYFIDLLAEESIVIDRMKTLLIK